jgi:hypothetical protein
MTPRVTRHALLKRYGRTWAQSATRRLRRLVRPDWFVRAFQILTRHVNRHVPRGVQETALSASLPEYLLSAHLRFTNDRHVRLRRDPEPLDIDAAHHASAARSLPKTGR